MDLGLKGKVAIITGGSDGIGKAAAISMASEGAKVAIVGRTQEKLDAAVAEVRNVSSGEAIGVAADVSVESDVKAMVAKVVGEFGQLDILVNNAGTSAATTLEQMTDEQLGEWGKEYDKWKEENGHLPNLQPAEAIITRIKAQNNPNAAQPQQPAVVNSQEVEQLKKQIANLSDSVKVLENKQILNVQDQWQNKVEEKLDILMKHLGVK